MAAMDMLSRRRVSSSSGDDDNSDDMDPIMAKLLITLTAVVAVGICCVALLFLLRRVRHSKKQQNEGELPMYHPNAPRGLFPVSRKTSNHRRLTITASRGSFSHGKYPNEATTPNSATMFVYDEKKALFADGTSPPPSPVPEIRITLPEETDEAGRKTSGRVVVVRMGETSVGLEPLQEDLPPYEKTQGEGSFQNLDLDRMGGLKESAPVDEKKWF